MGLHDPDRRRGRYVARAASTAAPASLLGFLAQRNKLKTEEGRRVFDVARSMAGGNRIDVGQDFRRDNAMYQYRNGLTGEVLERPMVRMGSEIHSTPSDVLFQYEPARDALIDAGSSVEGFVFGHEIGHHLQKKQPRGGITRDYQVIFRDPEREHPKYAVGETSGHQFDADITGIAMARAAGLDAGLRDSTMDVGRDVNGQWREESLLQYLKDREALVDSLLQARIRQFFPSDQ